MPVCPYVRRFKKKKKREGRKRKRREELCSWLHLPASVISIHCECKQNRAMKEENMDRVEEGRGKKWRRQRRR